MYEATPRIITKDHSIRFELHGIVIENKLCVKYEDFVLIFNQVRKLILLFNQKDKSFYNSFSHKSIWVEIDYNPDLWHLKFEDFTVTLNHLRLSGVLFFEIEKEVHKIISHPHYKNKKEILL